jgi:hypothetical protein
MNKSTTVAELADVMIGVHRDCALNNADFCASLISCAVSIAARDGLTDEQVLKHAIESATSALGVVRANQQLEAKTAYTDEEVRDIRHQQDVVKWKHAVAKLPADDPRHVAAKAALKKAGEGLH